MVSLTSFSYNNNLSGQNKSHFVHTIRRGIYGNDSDTFAKVEYTTSIVSSSIRRMISQGSTGYLNIHLTNGPFPENI